MMLSSKGSSDTCISEVLPHIPPCRFHGALEVADKPRMRRVSALRPSLSCIQQSPFSLCNIICEFS